MCEDAMLEVRRGIDGWMVVRLSWPGGELKLEINFVMDGRDYTAEKSDQECMF